MEPRSSWTFLSNHAHVLIALAQDPSLRLRDIGEKVGITERAVAQIVADLEAAGALAHERDGRRNLYRVNPDVPLRHAVESHRKVGDLIYAVIGKRPA